MSRLARLTLGSLILVALVPLSCRTYGGYGSEEASLKQMEAAHQQFARDLGQAQNDLRLVGSTDGGQQSALATRFAQAVEAHQELVQRHESLIEDARANAGSYRYLSRTLRGMISEQEAIYRTYQRIINEARVQADSTYASRSGSVLNRPHVVPPYFERMQNASYFRPVGGVTRFSSESATTRSDTVATDVTPTDTVAAGQAPAIE